MQRQECISRDFEDYKLTIVLNPKKFMIRALERETSTLYACQFKVGSLPQKIIFVYENQENFFEALISEQNIRISKERLIAGYKVFRNNQAIQRQISIPLVKMEADEFESLQKKVAALEIQVQKIPIIEAELQENKKALIMLQQRTNFYHYCLGPFKPLILDASNNAAIYKLRENYLYGKPRKSSHQLLANSLMSNQPIDEEEKLFSYKVTVTEAQGTSGRVFLGLCAQKERQNNVFQSSNYANSAPSNTYAFIGKNIQVSTEQSANQLFKGIAIIKVGDVVVLTVDLQNCSMTWFKNEVSIERSYFERPTTNVYPFIYLSPNTEVAL